MIEKLALRLLVLILLKIEFRHTQISVLKIGISISKIACIKPFRGVIKTH